MPPARPRGSNDEDTQLQLKGGWAWGEGGMDGWRQPRERSGRSRADWGLQMAGASVDCGTLRQAAHKAHLVLVLVTRTAAEHAPQLEKWRPRVGEFRDARSFGDLAHWGRDNCASPPHARGVTCSKMTLDFSSRTLRLSDQLIGISPSAKKFELRRDHNTRLTSKCTRRNPTEKGSPRVRRRRNLGRCCCSPWRRCLQ